MRRSIKKFICLFMTLTLMLSLAACGQKQQTKETNKSTTKQASKDTSSKLKKVDLNVYVMGNSPNEDMMKKFYEQLDKLTQKDLNATVRFSFSTWDDWANKYNLMLASGDNIDLCYSADWVNYPTHATKGAFMELDNMLPENAPNIWESIKPATWDAVRVKGKIYGVPNQYPEFVQHGAIYREDLRKKYNLPEIKDIETLQKYIETIITKENMKTPVVESQVMKEFFVATTKYQYIDSQDSYGMTKGLLVDPKNLTQTVIYYEIPEYKEMLKTMKSWADKGFWSKSILSNKEDAGTLFETGKSPIIFEKLPMKAKGTAEKCAKEHPNWEIGYFNYNDMNGLVYPCRANHNVMAVPRNAKNPKRALMFLDKLQSDRAYFDLCTYGIKGLNYNLTSDGVLDYSNIDTKINAFDIAPWAWRTDKFFRKTTKDWANWETLIKDLKSRSKQDPLDGFVFDVANVQSEIAAVSQVQEQYAKPLETGLVEDIDKGYDTLMEKLKEAGIDKVKAEVDKQLKEFAK